MSNILSNQDLRAAFLNQMEAMGWPVVRVSGGHAANQLYSITAGPHAGKKVRLRTNRDYAVMSLATTTDFAAPIPSLGDVDFAGIVYVNRRGDTECYLVPAARLISDFQAGHRMHTEGLNRPSSSRVRCLYFADKAGREWQGYARKYAEFRLSSADLKATFKGGSDKGGEVIERARRMIGEALGVPPSAIRISVDLVHDRF
jgi:hypothetical protein